MKRSRLKIIAYVVIIEILFIGIVDPLLSIYINPTLNSRIIAITVLISLLVITIELFSLPTKRNKNKSKIKHHQKSKAVADTKSIDQAYDAELVDSLTKEFSYTIDELKQGKKSRFDWRDIDIVTEYLDLTIGGSISGGYNGARSLSFKTEKGYILLDIVDSQLKTFLDNKKHYEVWFNDQQIFDLSEVVLTK